MLPILVAMKYEQQPFKQFQEVTGGPAELFINGKSVGKGEIKAVVPARFSATETLDIGKDLEAPVSEAYRGRNYFPFTGEIQNVTIEISPTQPLKK
jgi:arylsulfatase